MLEFLRSTPAQAIIWVTVLIVLCTVAAYVVKRFRNRADSDDASASELLTGFRDMSEHGGITPEEFRQIKAVLRAELQRKLEAKVESEDTEGDG